MVVVRATRNSDGCIATVPTKTTTIAARTRRISWSIGNFSSDYRAGIRSLRDLPRRSFRGIYLWVWAWFLITDFVSVHPCDDRRGDVQAILIADFRRQAARAALKTPLGRSAADAIW